MIDTANEAKTSPWDRVPVLLHPGFHKTGTTWLQDKAFTPESGLPFKQIATPRELIRYITRPSEREFDAEAPREAFEERLLEAEAEGAIAVLTCERLAEYPFQNRHSRPVIARRLAAAFPTATVLWTIREQESVILSMYGQTVRFGESYTLDEFLFEPDWESGFRGILNYDYYEYDEVLDLYESLFERVIMYPFEAMVRDPQPLFDKIFEAAGRPSVTASIDKESKVNAALSPPARWTMRQVNRLLTKEMRNSRPHLLKPNAIASKVDQFVPQSVRANGKARDKALVRERVGDRYAASNARLQEKLGIDLGALGYRLP